MDLEQLTGRILKYSFTKSDVARRLRLLRQYLETCFYKPERDDMTKYLLSQRATTEDIDAFIRWGDEFFKTFTKQNAYKMIAAIEKSLKVLPIVALYIPYEPIPAETVKLGKWFRKHVGDAVLMDLRIDPTLLGGCAFVWRGVYRDYSLRYYMQKKKDQIMNLVEQYVAKFYEAEG